MKTLLPSIALIALLTAGCTSPGKMAALAKFAAFNGASLDLAKSPGHCSDYKKVVARLDELDAAANYDPAEFTKALGLLPIKQLSDPRATIIIGDFVMIWDFYSDQIVTNNQVQLVKPVLQGTDIGLKRALIGSKCQ